MTFQKAIIGVLNPGGVEPYVTVHLDPGEWTAIFEEVLLDYEPAVNGTKKIALLLAEQGKRNSVVVPETPLETLLTKMFKMGREFGRSEAQKESV